MTRPVIRLKPRADARRIRRGAPTVFADDVALDRRTKALAPGTVATLEDAARTPLAVVATGAGRIAARVLDHDPEAEVDAAWLAARLARAADRRARLYDAPFHRLVHAEGDGLPGLIVDRFGEVAVVQPNAAWIEGRLDALCDALADLGVTTVLKNAGARARAQEGLDDAPAALRGRAPEAPVPVAMNGATYLADLMGGQKTGLFYDQRENQRMAARLARGRVLDVFSHVGGFGLAMLAGGAEAAVLVDASAPALALAEGGAARMGASVETRRGDAFDVLRASGEAGEVYDTVVCDPPAFAPVREAADKGLRAYERTAMLAAPLVAPGGVLALCSCSHAADLARFREASLRGVGRARRRARIVHTGFAGPDHPVHPALSATGYLKALFLALD